MGRYVLWFLKIGCTNGEIASRQAARHWPAVSCQKKLDPISTLFYRRASTNPAPADSGYGLGVMDGHHQPFVQHCIAMAITDIVPRISVVT